MYDIYIYRRVCAFSFAYTKSCVHFFDHSFRTREHLHVAFVHDKMMFLPFHCRRLSPAHVTKCNSNLAPERKPQGMGMPLVGTCAKKHQKQALPGIIMDCKGYIWVV